MLVDNHLATSQLLYGITRTPLGQQWLCLSLFYWTGPHFPSVKDFLKISTFHAGNLIMYCHLKQDVAGWIWSMSWEWLHRIHICWSMYCEIKVHCLFATDAPCVCFCCTSIRRSVATIQDAPIAPYVWFCCISIRSSLSERFTGSLLAGKVC